MQLKFTFFIRILIIFCYFKNINGGGLTKDEYLRLPQLFHLDDYHRCLTQKNGIYCLATYHLTSPNQPHRDYDLIKKYSDDVHHFNRTFIHRGWCLSARCPSNERNITLRVERCVNIWEQNHAKRVTLQTLHYCKSHVDTQISPQPDTPQLIFMYIILIILFLNTIGTTYDLITGYRDKESSLLIAWSIPNNWSQLIKPFEHKDPRLSSLTPIQGARVIVLIIFVFAHTMILYTMVYLMNPQDMENALVGPAGAILKNGTTTVQMFIMFSSFLCAYNLLLTSSKKSLSIGMAPKLILKRLIRISPGYLFLVGYGATWWKHAGDGPLWSVIIGRQSNVCRQKFWFHVLYLENIIDKENVCYMQTWFLAVDMQLYIVVLCLTITLSKYRRKALWIIGTLFVTSCFLISMIAYINNWKSFLHMAFPETLNNLLRHLPSCNDLYKSPLGSLPACLTGLFIAYLQYHMLETANKFPKFGFLTAAHNYIVPLYIMLLLSGIYVMKYTSDVFTAAYTGLERFIFCILFGTHLIQTINVESWMSRFFSWRGWDILGRMSLAVMMIHWCVNTIITVSRPHLIYTSLLDISVDAISTTVVTYLLALPTTVMLELPMQRTLDMFIR